MSTPKTSSLLQEVPVARRRWVSNPCAVQQWVAELLWIPAEDQCQRWRWSRPGLWEFGRPGLPNNSRTPALRNRATYWLLSGVGVFGSVGGLDIPHRSQFGSHDWLEGSWSSQ